MRSHNSCRKLRPEDRQHIEQTTRQQRTDMNTSPIINLRAARNRMGKPELESWCIHHEPTGCACVQYLGCKTKDNQYNICMHNVCICVYLSLSLYIYISLSLYIYIYIYVYIQHLEAKCPRRVAYTEQTWQPGYVVVAPSMPVLSRLR